MFGLMGVWLRTRFLQFHPLVLGFLLVVLAAFGLSVLGGTLMMMYRGIELLASCRGYCSVSGPLQSVQRAELRRVILALQASCGAHLGVDNLNVVRHVGRLLDGGPGARPFEVLKDGDLLYLIDRMLQLRCLDTVKISKVKGHADDGWFLMVVFGIWIVWVTMLLMRPRIFGRRRVPVHVIDARRNLVGV